MSTLLDKISKPSQLGPVYILTGDDDFLRQDAAQRLAELFCRVEGSHWEVHDTLESATPFRDVIEDFASPGMFDDRLGWLLRLKHETVKKQQKLLQALWDQRLKNRLLVLDVVDWHYSARNTARLAFVKNTLEKNKCHIACRSLFDTIPPWGNHPWESELNTWTAARARRLYGLDIGGPTLSHLTDRTGNDPGRIADTLDKLDILLGGRRKVSEDIIDSLVPDSHATPVQQLVDALLNLDERKLFKTLRHIETAGLTAGKRQLNRPEERLPLIMMTLIDTIRWLITAHRFVTRHPDERQLESAFLKEHGSLMSSGSSLADTRLTKARASALIKSARRLRLETLLNWHSLLYETLRQSRLGRVHGNHLFLLFVDMFEKKLCPQTSA